MPQYPADPFTAALLARRDPFVVAALAILAKPWKDPSPGSKLRGVVYAWCAHDDKMGFQRGNVLSGEFEAK